MLQPKHHHQNMIFECFLCSMLSRKQVIVTMLALKNPKILSFQYKMCSGTYHPAYLVNCNSALPQTQREIL